MVVAGGRPPGSPTPDEGPEDRADSPTGQPHTAPDPDLIDPLKIASQGLSDVRTPRGATRSPDSADPARSVPDPLAVLSQAIERGETPDGEAPGPRRRGLLARLTPRTTTRAPRAADGHPTPQNPVVEPKTPTDQPRVTTWAEDFAEQAATGEWPAVNGDGAVPTRANAAPVAESPAPGSRRLPGRRRRGKDDVVAEPAAPPVPREAAAQVADPAAELAEREPLAAEEARLAALEIEQQRLREEAAERDRQQRAALHLEQARLAAEAAEAERIEADRAAAQRAEESRLEGLALAAVGVEDSWLAAERAEVERIQADRASAQQAEDDRLEKLRSEHVEQEHAAAERAEQERVEQDRAEQDRAAAERAEQDRAAAERAEQERAEQERAAEQARVEREQRRATPAAPIAPAPSTTPSTSPYGEPIPRFVEFRQGSVLRYVFGALFVVFAVAAVIAIFRAVSDGSSDVILLAIGSTAAAMVSWWALLGWAPPVVSISNGLLELSRGANSTSWDLRDPATEITFRGRPASRSWKAILRTKGEKPATISSRQVDPAQFVEIVEHYQSAGPEVDV
jgi:hypothetical protein